MNTVTDQKEIIIRLIEQDFKMIGLSNKLDAVGFNGDFPNVSYEIWDLLGISEEVQAGELDRQYWQWAVGSPSRWWTGSPPQRELLCLLSLQRWVRH